jgi:outer membrane receptor for monomeric catechols
MEVHMLAGTWRTVIIAVMAVYFSDGAFAVEGARPRHTGVPIPGSASSSRSEHTPRAFWRATGRKQKAAPTLAADRDPYADPAAPYKARRLSSPLAGQSILDTPGQVTVLTRQVLDDKNATSLKDALSSTAGVTVGR